MNPYIGANFTAILSASTTVSFPPALCLCLAADGNSYVIANSANVAVSPSGRASGVAVSQGGPNGAVTLQYIGEVSAVVSGVPVNSVATYVRLATDGTMQRVTLPSASDQIVGWADTLGNVQVGFFGQSSSLVGTLAGDVTGMPGANVLVRLTGDGSNAITNNGAHFNFSAGVSSTLGVFRFDNSANTNAKAILSITSQDATNPVRTLLAISGAGGIDTFAIGESNLDALTITNVNGVAALVAGGLKVTPASLPGVLVGSVSGPYSGLWLGSSAVASPSSANYSMAFDGSELRILSPIDILMTTGSSGQIQAISNKLTFWFGATAPTVSQVDVTSSSGAQPLTIGAQNNNGSGAGGILNLRGGSSGGGPRGAVNIISGLLTFDTSIFSPFITHASASSATNMTIRAQGTTGTNTAGGTLILEGGQRNGTAAQGGARLGFYNGGVMTEAVDLYNSGSNRVLSLCRGAAITSTQMPANTGDLVVYLGNATTVPTANPVGGGILYENAGVLTYRSTTGVVTVLGST